MDIPSYYSSLPHDLSGSRSKNRFRLELLWGVVKLLDLMETNQPFTMVFDYVCDIEIHYEDSLEFYQIKTRKNYRSYTTKQLTEIKGEGSILGKLYILCKNDASGRVHVAIVSNAPYGIASTEVLTHCFQDLPDETKDDISKALKSELGVETIDLSNVFYIQSNMDFDHPEDVVRGKLVLVFEKIKRCEPKNPNALYRLIVDTVTERACYEYSSEDYEDIIRLKGLSRQQFDGLLNLHDEESKTGIRAATEYIERKAGINERKELKSALPSAFRYLAMLHSVKTIENDISHYLEKNQVGDVDQAIQVLKENFDSCFPPEVTTKEKEIIYVVILKRFEDGVYEYETDI